MRRQKKARSLDSIKLLTEFFLRVEMANMLFASLKMNGDVSVLITDSEA